MTSKTHWLDRVTSFGGDLSSFWRPNTHHSPAKFSRTWQRMEGNQIQALFKSQVSYHLVLVNNGNKPMYAFGEALGTRWPIASREVPAPGTGIFSDTFLRLVSKSFSLLPMPHSWSSEYGQCLLVSTPSGLLQKPVNSEHAGH